MLYALAIWTSTFAVIGLALRFMSGFSPVRRYLADASYWLYLIHMPIVLALVALGASQWNGPVYVGIISAIVIMQVAFLGCPVLAFTTWMKRKYDPEFPGGWSFTVWLYQKYGRLAGIAVFVFFFVTAIVVRIIAF